VTASIAVRGFVKTFGQTRALDGLDLVVETGEVRGFLGPNGAGKTTTIRVLLGLLRADAGDVVLLGGSRLMALLVATLETPSLSVTCAPGTVRHIVPSPRQPDVVVPYHDRLQGQVGVPMPQFSIT
jgi:ABC-type Mn2+/Zn2+ transport system ATPase subunit